MTGRDAAGAARPLVLGEVFADPWWLSVALYQLQPAQELPLGFLSSGLEPFRGATRA